MESSTWIVARWLVVCVVVVQAGACSAEIEVHPPETMATTASAPPPDRTSLAPGRPLDPGQRYRVEIFDPPFSFSPPSWEWRPIEPRTERYLGLAWIGPERPPQLLPPVLSFLRLEEVYQYQDGRRQVVPLPDDLRTFLASQPDLEVRAFGSIPVGEVSGAWIEVDVTDAPPGSAVVGRPGTEIIRYVLAPLDETDFWLAVGERARLAIATVRQRTVVVVIEAAPEDFDRFLPVALDLLRTVRFEEDFDELDPP